MNIALCVFTDGRGEYLVRTLESLVQHIPYQFDYALMVNDSANAQYARWLDVTFPSFRHIHHAERIGFAGAIRSAWSHLPKCDYVFSLEDDFTFNEDIDIPRLARILDARRSLSQIVLKRQPWNSAELEAGGIVELHPDWYTEREIGDTWITEHNANFSTNPNLMPYHLTYTYDSHLGNGVAWPMCEHSEGVYGAWLKERGFNFAFLGRKFDKPKVEHIGARRVGNGY